MQNKDRDETASVDPNVQNVKDEAEVFKDAEVKAGRRRHLCQLLRHRLQPLVKEIIPTNVISHCKGEAGMQWALKSAASISLVLLVYTR